MQDFYHQQQGHVYAINYMELLGYEGALTDGYPLEQFKACLSNIRSYRVRAEHRPLFSSIPLVSSKKTAQTPTSKP